MNETITGEGIIQFHDSMAECEGRVDEIFLYRFSMLFATRSPSRPKGNNVHVMNNLSTKVISFIYMYFISHVWMLTNTFNNCFLF